MRVPLSVRWPASSHRSGAVRQRTGLSYDKAKAWKIAELVIRSEAVSKNRPADLINIAWEKVVEAGLELPGFTTLDGLAAKVRTEVNAAIRRGRTSALRAGADVGDGACAERCCG